MVNDRHAKEGGVTFFASFGKVAEARMRGGVFEVDRFLTGTHVTDQTLVGRQGHGANRVLVQTFGGHQHVTADLGVEQVDRAHLGAHGLTNPLHDNVQSGCQISGRVDLLNNSTQRVEHIQQPGRLVSSWGASSFMARR